MNDFQFEPKALGTDLLPHHLERYFSIPLLPSHFHIAVLPG